MSKLIYLEIVSSSIFVAVLATIPMIVAKKLKKNEEKGNGSSL